MKCRCGHGLAWHRRAARLSGWERGRGRTGPRPGAWLPCQFRIGSGPKCRCRKWAPE